VKLISIVTPCYNEEDNVREVYSKTKEIIESLKGYAYEHVFIDNASTDKTVNILKDIARVDKNVKLIVNSRNFGALRSPYYGLFQASGDAVILLFSDLQDPPALIKDFIKKWEEGFKIAIGVKTKSEENPIMFSVRKFYYFLIKRVSETEQITNFTGFGLYDRQVIDILRNFNDPYPYFRGSVAEIGFDMAKIEYVQPKRRKGKTTASLYGLYNTAMLGFVNHSMVPLRIATFTGFITAIISFMMAVVFLIYKLWYWAEVQLGMAPLAIGVFFFASVQLFFIGIIGEYIGAIYIQVKKRPLVIEKERINF
jgi:glycosyltransferase involved in cell wall biosynthesis